MRKNVFLHFFNRDSREIFGLYSKFWTRDRHAIALKRCLNACVLLCEDCCIMPPGFALEDEIAFAITEVNSSFLSENLIRLPIRERSLADYAEKKRLEYMPKRDRYSGLFEDNRISFLSEKAASLVQRNSRIGERIVASWEAASDQAPPLWRPVKKLLSSTHLMDISQVPKNLHEDGIAVTWAEISQRLPNGPREAERYMRDFLQFTYFRQYCIEFSLVVMSQLELGGSTFNLTTDQAYNFATFTNFLSGFDIKDLLLHAPADAVAHLRRQGGWLRFADAYYQIANSVKTQADLSFIVSQGRSECRYDWSSLARRSSSAFLGEFDGLFIHEISDAFSEAADILTRKNDLKVREPIAGIARSKASKRETPLTSRSNEAADLLIYVALEEELKVLAKHYGFATRPIAPVATGAIGGLTVHVISPRAMGRVAAAVEVTSYLSKHAPPKLILVLGLAGGFKAQDVEQGVVLCARTVVDLAMRKICEEEREGDVELVTKFRRKDYPLNEALYHVLSSSSCFDLQEWQRKAIEAADWPDSRRPSIKDGPVASVDEVVANSEWTAKLSGSADKLLGVEMEAGGVCAAAEKKGVPVAMLRIVSDMADPAKADDNWRKRGMITLCVLLDTISLPEVISTLSSA